MGNIVKIGGIENNQRNILTQVDINDSDVPILTDHQNEILYMHNWVAKNVVNKPIFSCLKNGFDFKIINEDQKSEFILEKFKEHRLDYKIKSCMRDSAIYGGSMLWMSDQNINQITRFDRIVGKLSFNYYDWTFWNAIPDTIPTSSTYYEPLFYSLLGNTINPTRCLIFKGVELPKRLSATFKYVGMSIFQQIINAIVEDSVLLEAVVNLVYKGSIDVFKFKDYKNLVNSDQEDQIANQVAVAQDFKSLFRAYVMDLEDDVSNLSATFSGLSQLMSDMLKRVAGATGIPQSIFLGTVNNAMNEGSNDLEMFADLVERYQKHNYLPALEILLPLLCEYYFPKNNFKYEIKVKPAFTFKQASQSGIDSGFLNNALSMRDLGFPEEAIADYLVKNEIISSQNMKKYIGNMQDYNETEEDDGSRD